MRKRNMFLAAVLSASMMFSGVTPAFAESLTDGETAVMEMAEETETEPMEEIPEAEQELALTETPEELPMEEIGEIPQEETGVLEDEEETLLESPEMTEKDAETEKYTKELIAQTSGALADTELAMGSSTYGVKTPDTIYYNAFKLYDENKRFAGVQVDQYTDERGTPESHWISYIWYYGSEEWGIYAYSEEDGGLIPVTISGKEFYNVWFDMFWLIQGKGEYGHAITGYQLNTSKATWDYTYTANDVKKDMQHKEWSNTLDVPDAFYKGACADKGKHAGLRPIQGGIYYLLKDGKMVRNKKMIVNGKAYLFGNDCKCYKSYVPVEEKWIKKSDGYYWQQDDGTILREGGWQTLGGSRYFLAYKSGRRKTGWQTWKGNKYYLTPSTGRLVTGLKTIEGNTYFLQYKTGEMVKGWKTLGKDKYYFNEQTGIMKKGMLTLNGKKYYFDKDGKQHFGWKSISGKAYFFDRKTGEMKQNTWIVDGNCKYYANKDGSRFSGIRSIKGKNYYFQTDGKLVTNKKGYKINGKKYDIDKNGILTLVK